MKNDIPYFSHDNNARNHPKMRILITEYGYEGYGRFWALNERIAETEGAFIDISKLRNKCDLATELRFTTAELDKFLNFLSDPEVDLINFDGGKISTDRLNETHGKVMQAREKARGKKQENNGQKSSQEKEESSGEKCESSIGKEESSQEKNNRREEKRIDKNRREEKGKTSGGSPEPPLSESKKSALELSELLLTSHRKEFPDYLSGKDTAKITKTWAVDVDYLIRIDKKSPETIRKVILWVKEPGNFWFHNIESGAKLRKQFERLYGEMITKTQPKTDPPERVNFIPSADETNKMLDEQKKIEVADGFDLAGEYRKTVKETKNEGH
jgi:hypothetical protein